MSQYEFESNHDGDWDDHENIAWNEADWQKFLRTSDKDVVRFINAYNQVKDDPDRLDATAEIMGWHRDDWSSMDEIDLDDEAFHKIRPLDMEEVRKMDPYTIHRHPVYISSTALFSFLRAAWDQLMRNNNNLPEPSLSWSYSSSLADAEKHCLLAANCLDLGDFLLAVCHLKKAHSALNESMRLNRLFSHHEKKVFSKYLRETDLRMHDLREIYLRIIQDCRR